MMSPGRLRVFSLLLALAALVGCATSRPLSRADLYRAVGAPGVRQLQDSLFLDEAEVANLHWLEYLHFVRRDSSAAFYRAQLPDSTAFPRLRLGQQPATAPTDSSYLRYPGFRFYPVVGITAEQARNYCRWRTAVVRQSLQTPDAHRDHTTYYGKHRQLLARYDVTVTYRLPTPAEWELGASRPAPPVAHPPSPALAGPALAAIASDAPNGFGLHHLSDNVAEFTDAPVGVKGGSWFRPGVPPQATQPNPGPQGWLGFRCACVVAVRPKAAPDR